MKKKTSWNRNDYFNVTSCNCTLKTLLLYWSVCDLTIKTELILLRISLILFSTHLCEFLFIILDPVDLK